jgi:antibiotic biosynthesis monooxygenase (ABM) superfamily enzyme
MIPTPPSFFFRTNNSKKTKLSTPSVTTYSKRAFIAVIVAIPMAFGLNIPLNSIVAFIPVWEVIMINAIVIPSYMTFMIPRASKLVSNWLSPKQNSQPDLIPEIRDFVKF